jgi:hypothetical protein
MPDLHAEFCSTTCRCGAWKRVRRSFCGDCYFKLPKDLRDELALCDFGQGYEQAFYAACELLGLHVDARRDA